MIGSGEQVPFRSYRTEPEFLDHPPSTGFTLEIAGADQSGVLQSIRYLADCEPLGNEDGHLEEVPVNEVLQNLCDVFAPTEGVVPGLELRARTGQASIRHSRPPIS